MSVFYETGEEGKLSELFKLFDRDGNGKITAAELRNVMSCVAGEKVSEAEITGMISEADKDGNGTIELNEFITVMKSHRG
jgi:calmodulin